MVLALAVISRFAEEVRASAACGVAPLHINMSRSDLRFGQHERRRDSVSPGLRPGPS